MEVRWCYDCVSILGYPYCGEVLGGRGYWVEGSYGGSGGSGDNEDNG